MNIGLKLILSINNYNITIVRHNIWQKTMNIVTSLSSSERPHRVVPPVYVQLCNLTVQHHSVLHF